MNCVTEKEKIVKTLALSARVIRFMFVATGTCTDAGMACVTERNNVVK
ncbi:MAG: hypothetical protein QF535_17430 [Anaerolineales bacterium]|nr:hypothetical protein [Anaerolineales bacterium]